jgi:hypothetical protein
MNNHHQQQQQQQQQQFKPSRSFKLRDAEPKWSSQHYLVRKQTQALLEPTIQNVITPFIKKPYTQLCFRENRVCTPCYSFIRRFKSNERQSYPPNHGTNVLFTVMVTLNESYDYGNGGGFYFVKSSDYNQQYVVKLSLGDAIIFQSDLLNGIHIYGTSKFVGFCLFYSLLFILVLQY